MKLVEAGVPLVDVSIERIARAAGVGKRDDLVALLESLRQRGGPVSGLSVILHNAHAQRRGSLKMRKPGRAWPGAAACTGEPRTAPAPAGSAGRPLPLTFFAYFEAHRLP